MSHEPMTSQCQCEHQDHFEGDDRTRDAAAAVDARCHAYGAEIDIDHVTQVHTIFGRFTVCVDCARTHFPKEVLA